jgi:hypothetical protein
LAVIRRLGVALLAAMALGACAAPQAPYPSGDVGFAYRARDAAQGEEPQSLFPSDRAVLSDSAIRRILGYRLTLEDVAKATVAFLSSVPVTSR